MKVEITFLRGCGEPRAGRIEGECRQGRVVGWDHSLGVLGGGEEIEL